MSEVSSIVLLNEAPNYEELVAWCSALMWDEFHTALLQEGVHSEAETIEATKEDSGHTFVGLDCDGSPIGFAGLFTTTDAYGSIYPPGIVLVQLAVAPSARRKGVGRKLLGALEDWMKVRGDTVVRLYADRKENVPYYIKLGYIQGATDVVWGEKVITLFEKSL